VSKFCRLDKSRPVRVPPRHAPARRPIAETRHRLADLGRPRGQVTSTDGAACCATSATVLHRSSGRRSPSKGYRQRGNCRIRVTCGPRALRSTPATVVTSADEYGHAGASGHTISNSGDEGGLVLIVDDAETIHRQSTAATTSTSSIRSSCTSAGVATSVLAGRCWPRCFARTARKACRRDDVRSRM